MSSLYCLRNVSKEIEVIIRKEKIIMSKEVIIPSKGKDMKETTVNRNINFCEHLGNCLVLTNNGENLHTCDLAIMLLVHMIEIHMY